ncbi:MAG: SoxR reducing system RseC family protein [Candidatus Omnitrophica bacterium]|nr:SoxR reducing system RseC family protein [Candidatus Omnitrophota bacterium]MCM8777767.1 SoxR reducing system RseC family protein [Candidatus Omnitrophota bacterium]
MLEERGRVVDVKGEIVIVELEKGNNTRCGSCGICSKGQNGRFFLEAINNGMVKTGDIVVIRIDDSAVLKGVLFIYGLPLAGFIAGLILVHYIQALYLKVVIFLSVFTAIWYYGLKKGQEIGKQKKPEIIDIKESKWN